MLVGSALAYATLAVLVSVGALTGIDHWAAVHLMPDSGPSGTPSLVDSVVPLRRAGFLDALGSVESIVTLPGQVVVSALVAAAAWTALRRQGRTETAVVWASALFLATALEVVGKEAIARPTLHRHGALLAGFDSSWPSGHAVRAAVVAMTLAAAWPRLRPLLVVWLAAVVVLLEATGAHTPSDLLGGLLLAAFLGAGARLAEQRWPRPPSALLRGRARAGARAAAGRRRGAARALR